MLALATDHSLEPTPLRHYVEVLRRRKWTLVAVALAVPIAAVVLSLRSEAAFQGASQVLLSDQNLSGELGGGQFSPLAEDPDRVVATQARIARTPDLARRVLRATGIGSMTVGEFIGSSSVTEVGDTNILEFTVVSPDPDVAERLATGYGQQFVRYSRAIETAAIERAQNDVRAEMARVASQGGRDSALFSQLSGEARRCEPWRLSAARRRSSFVEQRRPSRLHRVRHALECSGSSRASCSASSSWRFWKR